MTTGRPDPDLLADLDAGLVDEPRAGELRAGALADPASAAVLDALAATRAELTALPLPPIPAGAPARWALALEEAARQRTSRSVPRGDTGPAGPEAPGPAAPSSSGGPADTRRGSEPAAEGRSRPAPHHPASRRDPSGPAPGRSPRRPRPALVVGALLAAVLVGVGVARSGPDAPPALTSGPGVARVDLAGAGLASVGIGDTGELADPTRRAACLRAVGPAGVSPDAPLLGGRRVTFEGTPGVLLVLGTATLGTFDVVVVDTGCRSLLRSLRVGP